MDLTTRRTFLESLAKAASAVVLAPLATACSSDTPAQTAAASGGEVDPLAVPRSRPADWDPIAFNRTRGNAGAIPQTYWPQINGPDGATNHLGKHLPYVPAIDAAQLPAGHLALMWGDPSKGYARHPNAVPGPDNNGEGHWFNWIEVRKAIDGEASVARSSYGEWPGEAGDPHYLVEGGGDIRADAGKHTIYLAALPPDVVPGDLVRIHAHCLTHGEYVDFLVVPG